MDINECIQNKTFTIKVKTQAKKTRISHIKEHKVVIEVAAPAQQNKANREVIKFFTRLFKRPVRIIKGKTTREKVLQIENS